MFILFGSGSGAEKVIKYNKKNFISFICDNDKSKWGQNLYGFEIKDPNILLDFEKNKLKIMVASTFYEEIKKQLEGFGFIENVHFWNELKEIADPHYLLEKKISEIIDKKFLELTTNLSLGIQLKALNTSVEFINKNLINVEVFDDRFELLKYAISKVNPNLSLFLEFGVYKGESINYVANLISPNKIFGFDSFEGLPEKWRAGFDKGTFKLDDLPIVLSNVKLIKGLFSDSLPIFLEKNTDKCAFIHIDCDLYSSTVEIFDLLFKRITKGTVIVFDEYFNFPNWEAGEHKAFMEFVNKHHSNYEFIGYNRFGSQIAVRII